MMELRSLRHVVALARRLNYQRAADELGLTQPALTRSIQVTEARCGFKLFDRDRSGVHLTVAGRTFVKRAEALLREAADFERVMRRCAEGDEGEIAFGMAPFAAKVCLPKLLTDLLAERPNLRVNIPVRQASALLPLLLAEEIEFMICTPDQIPDGAPVRSVVLGSFSTALMVRAGHPLLRASGVDPSSFPVVASGHFGPGNELTVRIGALSVQPPQVMVESSEALSALTQSSDAIWVSSRLVALDEIATGKLVEVPLPASEAAFPVLLYCLDRRTASPIALEVQGRLRRIFGGTGSSD